MIRSYQTNRPLWKKVNAETNPGVTYTDLKTLLDGIMSSEVSAFKINLEFGVVVYNTIVEGIWASDFPNGRPFLPMGHRFSPR